MCIYVCFKHVRTPNHPNHNSINKQNNHLLPSRVGSPDAPPCSPGRSSCESEWNCNDQGGQLPRICNVSGCGTFPIISLYGFMVGGDQISILALFLTSLLKRYANPPQGDFNLREVTSIQTVERFRKKSQEVYQVCRSHHLQKLSLAPAEVVFLWAGCARSLAVTRFCTLYSCVTPCLKFGSGATSSTEKSRQKCFGRPPHAKVPSSAHKHCPWAHLGM